MLSTAINSWMIACRSRELGTHTPLAITVTGHHLVLFRDATGAPVALQDRCAHRNTPLSSGTLKHGILHCAYHGWSYGADGRVCEVPALPKGTSQGY